jgi:two-component system, LuxR family, sensor kinase FixL
VVQRQELVRSKDVLGMHVQARTQEIQKLKGRYEQVLNSAGEGIYGLDQNGKTTFVNPAAAKLTGWSVEEMVGKLEMEIFQRPVDGATNAAANGPVEVSGSEGNVLAEHVFRRRDGTSFPVEYHRTPIMETDRMVGAVIIFRDITERKRAEESISRKAAELARSNAELEQFAYVASHDLQEPLRKIQAFGGRLKTKVEAAKLQDGRDYLDRMLNAAARMQKLISDLLTFSRVLSSSRPFVKVDLGDLVRDVLSDLEVSIEQSKARVEFGTLPVIEGDPTQLRQVLQNLISNSVKFQPPGQSPVIQIEAQVLTRPFSCVKHPTPDDRVCELSLKDNGIGFDEQYLDKVFAVFQRLHGRSEYDGTGVGLAVCRRIVDRHGGTIIAKSKPGEGATFIVALPVRQYNEETDHEQ